MKKSQSLQECIYWSHLYFLKMCLHINACRYVEIMDGRITAKGRTEVWSWYLVYYLSFSYKQKFTSDNNATIAKKMPFYELLPHIFKYFHCQSSWPQKNKQQNNVEMKTFIFIDPWKQKCNRCLSLTMFHFLIWLKPQTICIFKHALKNLCV